ncbi:hypothetical protein TRFO_01672 [Tritrichomonas foetus]|uniref:Nucleotide-diphospho-sugar transferase domain-containing protein n=1 Tax=Tritrichomonas foetus TaxID=1144522 RepID=A0A1J4JRN4_9EUKA|nr:hypothetical protein TRFO_01672 [Tritrichomonas foetus]|eukprot:OHT01096.1 hypothetical protein TRFO_01672 [Tritrichomonas foetus]
MKIIQRKPNKFQTRLLVLFFILLLTSFTFTIFALDFVSSNSSNSISDKKSPNNEILSQAHPKCPICNFTSLHKPTSTRRDVVLAAALTELKRVEYFLRTLRTTGTLARVILFLDSKKTASTNWLKFFSACNIEPVFISKQDPVVRSAPKLSRYYFYQQWLSKHITEVDRVLHTDTFDVIFQSDPFIPIITQDSLFFTIEPVSLGGSHWTDQWITQCYGKNISRQFSSKPVSCSGVTVGGAAQFLTYLDVLLSTPKWVSCFGHSLDQAHHNFLWYTGEFEKAGVNIKTFDCNSPYLTMHFCCKRAKCEWKSNGVMFGNSSTVAPVLVHQYNRWKNLTARNPVFCPAPPGGVTELTVKGKPAKLEELPPLSTELPKVTLWPP